MLRRTVHLAVAFVLLILSGLAAVGQEFVRGPGAPDRRARVVLRGTSTVSLAMARAKDSSVGRLSGLPVVTASPWPALTRIPGATLTAVDVWPTWLEQPPLPPRAPPPA